LVLLAPSAIVQRAMELMHLQNFFDLAPDFASAQQLIEKRTREAAATRRTTAALNPMFWQGEITAANANQVWEMTQAYITSPLQQRELVIDLSGVRFLDSNGVSVMIRAKRLAQHQGAKLAFIGPQSAVRNVLHLSQLEEFLLEETSRERRVR
jgi:anti-anti-sigma factor